MTESSVAAPRRAIALNIGCFRGGPRTLAALRIATGIGALLFANGSRGFRLPPESLWFPPPGTAWLSFLPASQDLYDAAVAVLAISATAVIVGWRPKWSASLAALAIFYAGWVTTLTGKVNHSHHIMWVLVILAVSPSANTWAVRRENRPGSYRWPVAAVTLIIGLVYFGAGLQKLTSVGFEWGWSDNLVNTMLNLAWQRDLPVHGWLIDRPLLGRLLGTGALVFELSFLPLLLMPATRRWVWPLGLFFHWSTWMILGISFLTLQLLYVVFLPFDRGSEQREPTALQRRLIASLLAVIAVFAVGGSELAWPVAAYPGFASIQQPRTGDVEVLADGHTWFVTKSAQADAVGRSRIVSLVASAIANEREAELAEWLGADYLNLVFIDTISGVIVERHPLYP